MLLHETMSDLAGQEEKQKRPLSDLDAYIEGRHGSKDGALCNDRAKEVLVIIHATSIIFLPVLHFSFVMLW